MSDAVLTAHRHGGVKEHITLGVRKEDGAIYIVILDLPVRLLGRALTAITHEKEITLAELGELDI